MGRILRFYLFNKNSAAHRRRNGPAASLVFFFVTGFLFGVLPLGVFVYRQPPEPWPYLFTFSIFSVSGVICWLLTPRALRVHDVLEKYKDPLLFENELFRTQDQDVAEALVFDSFGRTEMAINKLKLAIAANPNNAQAAHLLKMIDERDGAKIENVLHQT